MRKGWTVRLTGPSPVTILLERTETYRKKNHQLFMNQYQIDGLTQIGEDLLLLVLREFNDAHDIQTFLTLDHRTSQLRGSKLFKWAVSRIPANFYTTQTVPFDRIDIVWYYGVLKHSWLLQNEFIFHQLRLLTPSDHFLAERLNDLLTTIISRSDVTTVLVSLDLVPILLKLLDSFPERSTVWHYSEHT